MDIKYLSKNIRINLVKIIIYLLKIQIYIKKDDENISNCSFSKCSSSFSCFNDYIENDEETLEQRKILYEKNCVFVIKFILKEWLGYVIFFIHS